MCEELDWIRTPAPHLRIIDDQLWRRVKQRQAGIHQASNAIRAALHLNARTGRRPKYPFSGLLTCGKCQRPFIVVSPTEYACSGWKYRGLSVCDNTIKVSRQLVESVLLEAIQKDLFTEEGYAIVRREVIRLLGERRRSSKPDLAKAKARLASVNEEIDNLLKAIKAGIVTMTTKSELVKLEEEQKQLRQHLNRKVTTDPVTDFLPNTLGRFKAALADLTIVTQHQVDKARGILRALMGGPIILHPTANGTERYLTAEVSGDYAGLFQLVTGCNTIKNKFGGGEGS